MNSDLADQSARLGRARKPGLSHESEAESASAVSMTQTAGSPISGQYAALETFGTVFYELFMSCYLLGVACALQVKKKSKRCECKLQWVLRR